jgi:conjugative transfer signal peptidase TraF
VHGQIVVACPPRSYAEIGRDHGYLISAGCPGGVAPVLELVAARAGDVAQLSSAGIEVNGSQLPGTSLLTADKRGDPPAQVAFATFRVPAAEIWLFTPKPNRYDSRYFRPVPMRNVLNVARPLLTSQ